MTCDLNVLSGSILQVLLNTDSLLQRSDCALGTSMSLAVPAGTLLDHGPGSPGRRDSCQELLEGMIAVAAQDDCVAVVTEVPKALMHQRNRVGIVACPVRRQDDKSHPRVSIDGHQHCTRS